MFPNTNKRTINVLILHPTSILNRLSLSKNNSITKTNHYEIAHSTLPVFKYFSPYLKRVVREVVKMGN